MSVNTYLWCSLWLLSHSLRRAPTLHRFLSRLNWFYLIFPAFPEQSPWWCCLCWVNFSLPVTTSFDVFTHVFIFMQSDICYKIDLCYTICQLNFQKSPAIFCERRPSGRNQDPALLVTLSEWDGKLMYLNINLDSNSLFWNWLIFLCARRWLVHKKSPPRIAAHQIGIKN